MTRISYRFYIKRDGANRGEIYPNNTPTMSCDADAEVKISLTGKFRYDDTIDWLHDRIVVEQIKDGITHPLYEFVVITAEIEHDKSGKNSWSIKAYDEGIIVKKKNTEERLYFKSGRKYTDVIQELLITHLGITRLIIEDSNEKLRMDREDWDPGTSYITIINTLLSEINYNSLWFDFNGYARVNRYRPPGEADVSHYYIAGENSIIQEAISLSNDVYNKYNIFTAVVSSPDNNEILTATSENNSPDSRISTVNIGRYPASIEKLDNISSQEELQRYVDNLRLKSMMSTDTVPFVTECVPHSVREVVAIQHEFVDGLYEEISWKMQLDYDGEMQHKAKKVIYE